MATGNESIDVEIVKLATAARQLGQASIQIGRSIAPDTASIEALHRVVDRFDGPEVAVEVAVVGETSAGKSMLINALIGEELLPTDSRAWTSTAALLEHGERFHAEALLRVPDKQTLERHPLTAEELGIYLTAEGDRTVRKRHGAEASVVQVLIKTPSALLRRGLKLLDTPGGGGVNTAHFVRARAALVGVDAVIFVSRPDDPLSATERLFLADAIERVTACMVVFTHRDEQPAPDDALAQEVKVLCDADQWEQLLGDRVRGAALAARFASMPDSFVSVSSVNRLAALRESGEVSAGLAERSNVGQLEELLIRDAIERVGDLHRGNVARLCELVSSDVARRCMETRELLVGDEQAEARLRRREAAVSRWIEQGGDTWQSRFDARCRGLGKELHQKALQRSEELNRKWRGQLGQMTSVEDIRAVVATLSGAPELLLADLTLCCRDGLAEAVEDVRQLLAEDDLEGPLTRWLSAQDVERRLGTPEIDATPLPLSLTEARAALTGGICAVGATGLATGGLVNLGVLPLGIVAPVLFPFLIGASLFLSHQWLQRRNARAASEAIVYLDEVRALLTGAVLEEINAALAAAVPALKRQINAGLTATREEVERVRGIIALRDELARDPETRQKKLAELEATIDRAHQISDKARELGGRIGGGEAPVAEAA